jgi:hypothetical protein
MKQTLMTLAKRLGKFTKDEAEMILEAQDIQNPLDELENEQQLVKQGETYFYINKPTPKIEDKLNNGRKHNRHSDLDFSPFVKWLTQEEVCKRLNITFKTLRNKCSNGDLVYRIKRVDNQNRYFIDEASLPEIKAINLSGQKYADAPPWARVQADKYVVVLKACEHIRGLELKAFIKEWNEKYPEFKSSYSSICTMRKRYQKYGIDGLLSQYGKSFGSSIVADKYFEHFKTLYLVTARPSIRECWNMTRDYAQRVDGLDVENFPCASTFKRKLKQQVPEQAICFAREGAIAWKAKYGTL